MGRRSKISSRELYSAVDVRPTTSLRWIEHNKNDNDSIHPARDRPYDWYGICQEAVPLLSNSSGDKLDGPISGSSHVMLYNQPPPGLRQQSQHQEAQATSTVIEANEGLCLLCNPSHLCQLSLDCVFSDPYQALLLMDQGAWNVFQYSERQHEIMTQSTTGYSFAGVERSISTQGQSFH